MMKTTKHAVILCAGEASRAGLGFNKILFVLGQKTVLETVLDRFFGFDKIVVAAKKSDLPAIEPIASAYGAMLTEGGKTRTESVRNALKSLKMSGAADGDIVAIHDAARPFVTDEIINYAVESAIKNGSGIASIKVTDSIKEASDGVVTSTLNRQKLYAVQTPQAFRLGEIISAYDLIENGESFEDDSEVFRRAGFKPVLTEGALSNKKLTVPQDFLPVDFCLDAQRIGAGFDVHELVKDRRLVLGGVEIPYPLGLLGHSDADVLLHAITDSVLSAAGLPDIGVLFPDTDAKYKGIDSGILLRNACGLLKRNGLKICNISAVIIAQKPKLAPYINDIKRTVAGLASIDLDCVNISATTTEFLGVIGEGKAIAASALCLAKNHE